MLIGECRTGDVVLPAHAEKKGGETDGDKYIKTNQNFICIFRITGGIESLYLVMRHCLPPCGAGHYQLAIAVQVILHCQQMLKQG